MADLRKFGNTSNLIRFVLKNATSGVGLTGLTSSSGGLVISTIADDEATATAYTAAGSTIESITTLGTFAAPTATKCRFKEVDATNHKGLYEFQFADARFAVTSARRMVVSVTGATNLLDADYEIQLVQFDPYAASMGLVLAKTTNLTGFNDVAATAIVSSGAITTSGGAVSNVTTVGTLTTYTGNTPQTGDNFARIGATGSGLTSLASQASVNTVDDFLDTEIADIRSRLPAALVSGRMDASIGAVAVSGTPLTDIGAAVVAAWKADSEVITLLADALAAKTNTDALTGATVAPMAPPAATATPMEILAWLLALSRNKLATTATAITLRNDGDTADIGHAAHAESAGTYTRDEWTS